MCKECVVGGMQYVVGRVRCTRGWVGQHAADQHAVSGQQGRRWWAGASWQAQDGQTPHEGEHEQHAQRQRCGAAAAAAAAA